MPKIDQYNLVSHMSQRASRPSQTPRSGFSQNVPFQKFATVSLTSHPQLEAVTLAEVWAKVENFAEKVHWQLYGAH